MTQSVFGRSDCSRLARFDFWGRFAVSVMPGRTSVRPRPGCWASGAPAQGPLSLLWPHCGLQTFPAPAPTRSFPVGASGARSRVSAHSCPNSAPSATRAGEGTPSGSGAAIGETQAPGAIEGLSRSPGIGQGGDNWRGARGPAPFPVVTCSLAGVSRGSRPLPALSPHAIAHAGSSGGPHAPEAAGWSAASRSCPGRRRPGSTAPAARHQALPGLPPGARCTPAPASPQTLRARGEREVADSPAESQVAGPGGPATVPGRRPAPLEGRREGAGTAAATPGSLRAPGWGRPPRACHSPA